MIRRRHIVPILLMAIVTIGGSGCGIRYLGDSTTLFTRADQRLAVSAPAKLESGRNAPRHIFCAEPSPDVAKAIAESTNVSGSLDAIVRSREAPAEGALKAAAAASRSRAEALAQLTNRLATIQLLRDSLYRACEAYANGALSEITYAIMLSRFDKVMVTLLTGELVAGNFGQSLAVLGTASSGGANAAAVKSQQDAAKAAESKDNLDSARTEQATAKAEANNAQKALNECKTTPGADCKTQQANVNTQNEKLATADAKLSNAVLNSLGDVSAAAVSNAQTTIALGVGAVSAGHATNPEAGVTNALMTMQRKYLENINADPLIVACLTVLDRSDDSKHGKELATLCKTEFPTVLKAQSELLRVKLIDSQSELVHGCMTAYRETASADDKVATAAKALTAFCDKQLVTVLKTQAELAQTTKQLQEAQLELERSRSGEAAKATPKPATPAAAPVPAAAGVQKQ